MGQAATDDAILTVWIYLVYLGCGVTVLAAFGWFISHLLLGIYSIFGADATAEAFAGQARVTGWVAVLAPIATVVTVIVSSLLHELASRLRSR